MEYNSGSDRASNFKSAKRVARGRLGITSTIIPELYDTKSNYQLIVSVTKYEDVQYTGTSSFFPLLKTSRIYFVRVANSGESRETTMKRTQFSADDDYPITKSSNWTAVIGYPRDRATIT